MKGKSVHHIPTMILHVVIGFKPHTSRHAIQYALYNPPPLSIQLLHHAGVRAHMVVHPSPYIELSLEMDQCMHI